MVVCIYVCVRGVCDVHETTGKKKEGNSLHVVVGVVYVWKLTISTSRCLLQPH